jgi:outer membrane biosynthesis protein TonB
LGLNEEALKAVGQWLFTPATGGGRAVRVSATVTANFRIRHWSIIRLQYYSPPNTSPPTLTMRYSPAWGETCGEIDLMVQIGANGVPADVRVVTSEYGPMNDPAIATLGAWRFKPATREGVPVAIGADVALDCEPWPKPLP